MEHWIAGTVLAAALGAAVSWLNYRLSRRLMDTKPDLMGAVSLPRQMLQIAYLAVVYLLSPLTPWGHTELLVGAVIGMTGAMFVFTRRLLKELERKKPAETEERGDENG